MEPIQKYQLNTQRLNQQFLNKNLVAFDFLTLLHQNGVEARFVGNVVRQYLYNFFHEKLSTCLPVLEYDICVQSSPQRLKSILSQLNIPCLQDNVNYGTFKIYYGHHNLELACLRRDFNHKGRHCSVEFIDSFELDSKRRDFTFNAITVDHKGCIYDDYDGIPDIKHKRVKFIKDAKISLQEDALRLWRYVRFCAEFGIEPNLTIMEYARDYSHLLKKLPIKKIVYEWYKIIATNRNVFFYLKMLHDYEMTQNYLGPFFYTTDSKDYDQTGIYQYYPDIPKLTLEIIKN